MLFGCIFGDDSESDSYVQKRKECMGFFLESISSAMFWLFDRVAGLLDYLYVPILKVIDWLSTFSLTDWLVIGLIFGLLFIIGSTYVIMKYLCKLKTAGGETGPPVVSNEYHYTFNQYQHLTQRHGCVRNLAQAFESGNGDNSRARNRISNPYLPRIAPNSREAIRLSKNSREPIRLSEHAIDNRNEPVPGQTTITELSLALNRIFRNFKDPVHGGINDMVVTPREMVANQMPQTLPSIDIEEIMRETNRRISIRRRFRSLSDDQLPAIEHHPDQPQFGVDVLDEGLTYPEVEDEYIDIDL